MFLQCDVSNSVESNKDMCHRSSKKGKSIHTKLHLCIDIRLNIILYLLFSVISFKIWHINSTDRPFVPVIDIWYELYVNVTCYSFPISTTGHYEKKIYHRDM